MGRDGDVRAALEAALHEPDVRRVDVALLRVGDLRGLEVRTLHDAEVGVGRQEPVEVVRSAVEVRLQDRADVLVARGPQALVDPERRVDELGLLHVDAHEEVAARGVRDEAFDVRVRGLLVEGEPEVRQLQREVRPEALAGEPVEELGVLAHDDVRSVRVRYRLAEQRRVRVQACVVQPPQHDDALVERLSGDEPAGSEAHAVAAHDALQEGAVRGAQDHRAGEGRERLADRRHVSRARPRRLRRPGRARSGRMRPGRG